MNMYEKELEFEKIEIGTNREWNYRVWVSKL